MAALTIRWGTTLGLPPSAPSTSTGSSTSSTPATSPSCKKARALGTALYVGVITDEDATWKRRPIMSYAERRDVVLACRHVDFVIERPPLRVSVDFLDRNGIDVVVHGDDDLQERFFCEVIAAERMLYVPYHKGISTSQILARIRERSDG